ncbi:MAG: uncharacterized protein QG656_744, partial [Candidatus Hydrogenedentes bacterium]|nr:uncharacterized protein [Candidatus Hydrogenedentota bacterium]
MADAGSLRARLAGAIDAIAIVDTHEHIPDASVIAERESSFFHFFEHYVSSDLVSAGMPKDDLERMRDAANGLSIADRWALMAPYWPFVRNTGYGQAMRAYMRDLFGVADIDGSTVADLSARIRAAHARPDWYRTVLKDKARIATSLLTRWPGQHVEVDREFFRAVPILDHFVMPSTKKDLRAIEQETGRSVQNLNDLINALETRLAQFVRQGIVGIKIFLAYR